MGQKLGKASEKAKEELDKKIEKSESTEGEKLLVLAIIFFAIISVFILATIPLAIVASVHWVPASMFGLLYIFLFVILLMILSGLIK